MQTIFKRGEDLKHNEAKRELQSYLGLLLENENLTEILNRTRAGGSLKAVQYDREIMSGGKTDISSSIARIETVTEMYYKKVNENNFLCQQIEIRINSIENIIYRNILRMKYIQGRKLGYVANFLKYNYDYVRRLNGRAISHYSKKIK